MTMLCLIETSQAFHSETDFDYARLFGSWSLHHWNERDTYKAMGCRTLSLAGTFHIEHLVQRKPLLLHHQHIKPLEHWKQRLFRTQLSFSHSLYPASYFWQSPWSSSIYFAICLCSKHHPICVRLWSLALIVSFLGLRTSKYYLW